MQVGTATLAFKLSLYTAQTCKRLALLKYYDVKDWSYKGTLKCIHSQLDNSEIGWLHEAMMPIY